jgi:hypothetical protein
MSRGDPIEPAESRSGWGARIDWTLVGLVFLLTLPPLVVIPGTGLDPSWKLGLHLARERGLTMGRDLFFTYGPWGFLAVPLTLVRSQWLVAVVYQLVMHLTFFAGLGLWMRRQVRSRWAPLALLPLVLFAPPAEYRPLLAALLWLGVVSGARRGAALLGAPVGCVAAGLTMVKFTAGVAACLIVLGGAVAGLLAGRVRLAVGAVAGFGIGVIVWGLVALGSLGALGRFVATSWEISVFKHAFVRQETHAFFAFSVGGAVLTWLWLERSGQGPAWARALRAAAAASLCLGALLLAPAWNVLKLPGTAARRVASAIETERQTRDTRHRARIRADLQQALPLGEPLRELIGRYSVDVMTVETALIETWDLPWRPRPVLQSYAVGTSKLDQLDAEFFASDRAPQRLLVHLQGLDTRHPVMDAPRTWRVLLSRYEPMARDSRWMLLALRSTPRSAVVTELGRKSVPVSEAVTIPQPSAGHLAMRVRLRPSLMGRIVSLPWKLPEIRVGLAGADLLVPRRIVPSTASSPFPLTFPWVESPSGLGALFGDRALPAPKGLAFFTGGSWAWRDAELEFLQVEWAEERKSDPGP